MHFGFKCNLTVMRSGGKNKPVKYFLQHFLQNRHILLWKSKISILLLSGSLIIIYSWVIGAA